MALPHNIRFVQYANRKPNQPPLDSHQTTSLNLSVSLLDRHRAGEEACMDVDTA